MVCKTSFKMLEKSHLGGVHKLRLQILPIFHHLPTSVYIGLHLDYHLPTTIPVNVYMWQIFTPILNLEAWNFRENWKHLYSKNLKLS